MLSNAAKLLLVMTSLAPILGAFGVLAYVYDGSIGMLLTWFGGAFFLLAACVAILWSVEKLGERECLELQSFRVVDQEVLTFLIVYLLPLITRNDFPRFNPIVTGYVLLVICWAVYHSNAFFFNPLLGLLGYHFYVAETQDGLRQVVVTREILRRASAKLEVVELFPHAYLLVKSSEGE